MACQMTAEELLAEARSHLDRVDAYQADELRRSGALLIDIRPYTNRVQEGEIPGAVPVERIVLEWRLDPTGRPPPARPDSRYPRRVAVQRGYASSLAARDVQRVGLWATDIIGGFRAWNDAGLSVVPLTSD